jgi:hypothetical protein
MRWIATTLLAVAVLLGSLTGSAPHASAAPRAEAGPENIPTLAYYYQWFQPASWNRAKTDYPLAGRYSSDDVALMRRQVQQAQSVGIDGFIVSWKDSPVNNRRLEALMRVAADAHFKLAVIYQGLDFYRHPLPVARVAADFKLFNTRYAGNAVYQIFDKPLLIWSGTWKFSAADIDEVTRPLRSSLTVLATEKSVEGYQRVAGSFDGDAYYWSSVDPAVTTDYQSKLGAMSDAVHEFGGLWIAPFAPGFNAQLVGGARDVPRRGGDTLRAEYSAAISSSPDALGLISWNEFSENTHVEPSVEYGDTALEVLASLHESRQVSLSPMATESDEQTNASHNSMTVQVALVILLLLFIGVTIFATATHRRKELDDEIAVQARPRRAVPPRRRWLAFAAVVVALGLIAAAVLYVFPDNKPDVTAPSPLYVGPQPVKDAGHVVVGAAGDISCPVDRSRTGEKSGPDTCEMQQTADAVKRMSPDAVLALGDLQYPSGSLSDFESSYAHSWGALRSITYPVPGNHEYGTPKAQGYFSYFGARAGEPDKGYYSYDLGAWHLVALNSECKHIGGCDSSSPQASWLKQDLAAHPRRCTLAYWHRPRFSSGTHGNNLDNDALWRLAADNGVDLVLNGHDHDYERYVPMDADGNSASEGAVEFVVGTGGASHYNFHLAESTSATRIKDVNGILRLDLGVDSYSWRFGASADDRTIDEGSAACHQSQAVR